MTNRDTVLTIAVGRNRYSNGVPLPTHEWRSFMTDVRNLAADHGTVVFHGTGQAVTSDGPQPMQAEESFTVIVINPERTGELRRAIATRLHAYDQHSACFSHDLVHEPVFSTADGSRPTTITAAEYAPAHGGYPG